MFQNVITFVKANKNEIVKKGAIALGTVVGLVAAGIVVKNVADKSEEVPSEPNDNDVPFEAESE